MGLPFFFFLPPVSSSATAAVSVAASSGSLTVKRYLHFVQSIFLPIMPEFLTRTFASQLGHGT